MLYLLPAVLLTGSLRHVPVYSLVQTRSHRAVSPFTPCCDSVRTML